MYLIRTRTSITMSTVWFLLALVCVCCFDLTFSHYELKNVAYSKQVTLSSQYLSYQGSSVVNGILSDYTHTAQEKSPWLRIDLGARYRIHEVEIFPRSDGHGNQLHDFDVRIGARNNLDDMHLCGHFTGVATNAQRIAIWCPHNTVGRYVQVQIVSGSSSVLTPAEILVWGVPEN